MKIKVRRKVIKKVGGHVSGGRQEANSEDSLFCKLWNIMVEFIISFTFVENSLLGTFWEIN